MSPTADIVVIGGGVNGASTAFHLAGMGVEDVVLLERRHLAAGATGKSGALVRMHYTNEHESRLAIESLKIFRNLPTVVGGDCGFEAPRLPAARGAAATRPRCAATWPSAEDSASDTSVVSRDEVRELFPGCRVDDIGAAA